MILCTNVVYKACYIRVSESSILLRDECSAVFSFLFSLLKCSIFQGIVSYIAITGRLLLWNASIV